MGEDRRAKNDVGVRSDMDPRGFALSKLALSENFAVGWMSIPQDRV